MAYGVMTLLLATTIPVQHRLSMRLHTLLGMKAGDMAFALHMNYDFGLWHICLGFRLWENYVIFVLDSGIGRNTEKRCFS
jgi:hypothetical protein